MGLKCSHPYKKTTIGEKVLAVGELDEPNWIIAPRDYFNYMVWYHEGPSSGMNVTTKTMDDAVKVYYKMLDGLLAGKSFYEMRDILSAAKEEVRRKYNE